jgi:uncharacterized protein YndB with AHSA1/START domain
MRPEMAMGDRLVLRLERTLPVSREGVFRALTDPEELAEWWGPKGFTSPSVDFHPQVGGSYRIAMQPPDGDLFHLLGEFREVEPPARLAYTFRWDPPNPDDQETLATLALEDQGDGTQVLFTQGEFATEERLALHRDGWTESFERLQQLLSQ